MKNSTKISIYTLNYLFLFGLIFTIIGIVSVIDFTKKIKNQREFDIELLTVKTFGTIQTIDTIINFSGEGETKTYKFEFEYKFNEMVYSSTGWNDRLSYELYDTVDILLDPLNPNYSKAKNLWINRHSKKDKPLVWMIPGIGLIILLLSFVFSRNLIYKLKKYDNLEQLDKNELKLLIFKLKL